jgi:hypothetical protein
VDNRGLKNVGENAMPSALMRVLGRDVRAEVVFRRCARKDSSGPNFPVPYTKYGVPHAHAPVWTKNKTSCNARHQASDQNADGSR